MSIQTKHGDVISYIRNFGSIILVKIIFTNKYGHEDYRISLEELHNIVQINLECGLRAKYDVRYNHIGSTVSPPALTCKLVLCCVEGKNITNYVGPELQGGGVSIDK